MLEWVNALQSQCMGCVLPNVWLGVSVENQVAADGRIPYLLETPAAVRFVSVEPMLEIIDLRDPLNGYPGVDAYNEWTEHNRLDWVIRGCESGPGARPFDVNWARDLRDQCQDAGVPFFFKQGRENGKIVKMPEPDGVVWNQYPEARR